MSTDVRETGDGLAVCDEPKNGKELSRIRLRPQEEILLLGFDGLAVTQELIVHERVAPILVENGRI